MRNRPILALFVATALLAGCHKAPKQVSLGAAFRILPLPPDAQALVKEGGVDAMQIVLVTPWRPDSVVAYYRKALSADPFHLVNERASGRSTALYAEQDNGPPIWVTVAPNGSEGSQVVIAGAKDADHPEVTVTSPKTADTGTAAPLPVRKP